MPQRPSAQPSDDIGDIHVGQSDLLQKRVTDNWVSYNGDYAAAATAA